ncbi:MAG TPA: hypothetical protein VG268_00660 [Streptosporangiaceae bacterium]|nr:hypothetical protein [Streptosporangiaceae bacterium]
MTLLRCALSVVPSLPDGAAEVPVGVGSDDPVGVAGDSVGEAGAVVGVASGELLAGVTAGATPDEPDLAGFADTDGTGLASVMQVELGLGLAVAVVPVCAPAGLLPFGAFWPVP